MNFFRIYILISLTCLIKAQPLTAQDATTSEEDVESLLVNEPQKESLPEAILDNKNDELIIHNDIEHQDIVSDEQEESITPEEADHVIAASESDLLALDSITDDYDEQVSQEPLETGPDQEKNIEPEEAEHVIADRENDLVSLDNVAKSHELSESPATEEAAPTVAVTEPEAATTPNEVAPIVAEEVDVPVPEKVAPHQTNPDAINPTSKKEFLEHPEHTPAKRIKSRARFDEGDEPNPDNMAQLNLLTGKDINFYIGGRLKDELFVYHQVHTFRSDYHDENNFVRHKLNLDMLVTQGTQRYGKPASQGCVRLTNYVFWQDESQYTPLVIDEIKIENENLTLAKDVKVRSLIPLIFVEQAWFKLNLDTFTDTFKNHDTFLKIGYFPYILGRGVTMGYHEDLAVDYLGWGGDGGFTRYPFMPPGVLFSTQLADTLTWDLYYNLWRETNAGLSDTLKPERWSRLTGPRPERGSGKNRITLATKLDFTKNYKNIGDVQIEPYAAYVSAPEQTIELPADASANLYTYGVMADVQHKNWSLNVELAGQCGAQRVHAIDRNQEQVTRSSTTGTLGASFSHVLFDVAPPAIGNEVAVGSAPPNVGVTTNRFDPEHDLSFLVQNQTNHDLAAQAETIKLANGQDAQLSTVQGTPLRSANTFGNARFRNPYKLSYQGFMALADLSYTFDKHPFMLAGGAGYISGDKYPYNEEVSRDFRGFIPLRSRYKGLGVQNFLIFDRLVIPRPLNISYRTLYAFNDQKDLSNLQFLGLGATWYPLKERKKMSVTTDIMWLWEAAQLGKWDNYGKHPDSAVEAQLERLRNTDGKTPTLFSGWETTEHASRMLGTEIDLKILYHPLDHCDFILRCVLFFPGQLYEDLEGQPNALTRRIDERGFTRFDSLGSQVAFAFVTGLNYRF